MMMEETQYLPSEELKTANYPELLKVKDSLQSIADFGSTVSDALAAYNTVNATTIHVDLAQVAAYVDLCRSVADVLGRAPTVCYDVLMDVREHQRTFQELLFIGRHFGDAYITASPSTETAVTTDAN